VRVVELKEFFRQRESVVFTLMLPVLLLVVFGAVLDFDLGNGVSFTQFFMAGSSPPASWARACRTWRSASRPSGPTGP
jgi:hypothetical protein